MAKAKSYRICVVGTGYVGLVTGACLARLGHRVRCVDSDKAKIKALKALKIPIYEPGLESLVRDAVRKGRLGFFGSIREGMEFPQGPAQVVFIAVGTPPLPDGSADMSFVEKVAEEVAGNLKEYTLVVEKSTVPVETGEWVRKTIERFNRRQIPFGVASNPEFLREGTAVEDFLHPDRVVLGVDSERAALVLREIYAPLKARILVTDVKSAELIKHASNSFLAMKISFINAVSNVCEKVGADVTQIAQGMGLDSRISPSFLRAGVGYGGSCFPKDLEAFYWISRKHGYDFHLLKSVKQVNEEQKGWPLRKLEQELWNLGGKLVAVLGLSFKPDTDDLRLAPSLAVIERLLERGCRVRVYDPVAMEKAKGVLPRKVAFASSPSACVKGADALLLVTEWDEFRKLDFKKIKETMRLPILLDGRNFYDPKAMRELGFIYHSVGRP